MKLKNNLPSLKFKILKPCKKMIKLFKFKLRRPVFIRALQSRLWKTRAMKTTQNGGRISKITAVLRSLRPKRDMDRTTELKSFSDAGVQKAPYSSPITPANIRLMGEVKKEVSEQDEVEDACRNFENYLIDLIAEEGKMRDLVDVEELLHYWKNLKSPVFVDLVCRFYAELCKDLFSNNTEMPRGIL